MKTPATSLLRYQADWRTLAFLSTYALTTYVSYYYYNDMNGWQVAMMLALNGFFSFLTAVIVHNTVHCPIFTQKTHNKAFQYVLSFIYGYSVSAFVPGHNFSHHKETQTLKDTTRTSKARFRWNLMNFMLFFFLAAGDILNGELRWAKKMYKEKPTWFYQWLSETLLVGGIKLALLWWNWQAALAFVWIPHFIGSWGLVGTNYWQHDGCDEHHPYNHSRSFTSPLFNFFMFNNGFHGAHHDRPGLHWSLLPEYHAKHLAPYLHPNLNRRSFFRYAWEAYIYPGKRLDYLGNPVAMPAKVADIDWTQDIRIGDSKHRYDFGAEAMNAEDVLEMKSPTTQEA